MIGVTKLISGLLSLRLASSSSPDVIPFRPLHSEPQCFALSVTLRSHCVTKCRTYNLHFHLLSDGWVYTPLLGVPETRRVTETIESELTYKIIGAAVEVRKILGVQRLLKGLNVIPSMILSD